MFLDKLLVKGTVPGHINYTGWFKMIVGVLTTCHTQHTWDSSICVFLFNRTTLQVFVTYLTGALYVHPLWFYKHLHDNRVRSELSVACQRWWFQWRFWFVPSVPRYLREEEEHKPDPWRNPIERNHMGLHLENEVTVVKTPTIISNNPVRKSQRNIEDTYWLTYLLTPQCRVLLEKLTGLQLVMKFPAFHGTRRFITALTSVHQLSLSWASPIQFIYPHASSWRSILILSTHLRDTHHLVWCVADRAS